MEESFGDFLFKKIVGEEAKLISKVNGTLSQFLLLCAIYDGVGNKVKQGVRFLFCDIAQIALVWNMCSEDPLHAGYQRTSEEG